MPVEVRSASRSRAAPSRLVASLPAATSAPATPGAGRRRRVLGATFVTLGITYGFWYAYAVFLVAFLGEFGWSRSVVAGAFSLLVARIFGMLHFANSLGGALGAWVAGAIFDATTSYALALPIAAAMALLAPTLLWVVAPRRPNPAPPASR